MKCPKCGKDNLSGYNFCIKCGTSLPTSKKTPVEPVDMGGYHSEDEEKTGGFTIGNGTFVINDRASANDSSDLYTADELNDSDEKFNFSEFDEPFIPKLDADRITLPEQVRNPQRNYQQPNNNINQTNYSFNQNNGMYGIPPQQQFPNMPPPQSVNGMPQMNQPQPMQNIPQMNAPQQPMMYGQPQFMGYDQNGMPVYNNQPQMYGQPPQFMGYDQNGMPVYSQPVMYGQPPQFMGYDQNGMPVYANQPVMYGQPQPDMNSMQPFMQPQFQQNIPPVQNMPHPVKPVQNVQPAKSVQLVQPSQPQKNDMFEMPPPAPVPPKRQQSMSMNSVLKQNSGMQSVSLQSSAMDSVPTMQMPSGSMQSVGMAPLSSPMGMDSIPPRSTEMASVELPKANKFDDKRVDVPDDFWEFFDGGKATKHKDTPDDDFFGRSDVVGDVYAERLKKIEAKKKTYMNDLPVADASALMPNENVNLNRKYMSNTDIVDARELAYNEDKHIQDRMRVTDHADADALAKNQDPKTWDIMSDTDKADASSLDTYVREHKESMMAQADKAVEALPSKKHKSLNEELDAIELPDYMKARRKAKTEKPEISALPK